MAKITSLAELEIEVTHRINRCLRQDITPLIKQEIQKAVDDVIYDTYDPKIYKRRKDNGGLRDEQNMTAVFADCSVDVYNDTSATGRNFDPLDEKIEYGYGALDQPYNVGLPFMDTAQANVNHREKEIGQLIQRAVNKG